MQDRITLQHLKRLAAYLNKITNSPLEMFVPGEAGSVFNDGHWHISQAYGGYSLERITSPGGATTSPISTRHITARKLYIRMCSFIQGIEFVQRGGVK